MTFQIFFLWTLYFWWTVSSLSFDFGRSCFIFTVAICFKKQPKRMPGTESVRSSRATNGSRVAPRHLPGFPSRSPSETNTENKRTNIAYKIACYSQRGFYDISRLSLFMVSPRSVNGHRNIKETYFNRITHRSFQYNDGREHLILPILWEKNKVQEISAELTFWMSTSPGHRCYIF